MISRVTLEAVRLAAVHREMPFAEIPNNLPDMYGVLYDALRVQGCGPVGPDYALYREGAGVMQVWAAAPIEGSLRETSEVTLLDLPQVEALHITCRGDFSNLPPANGKLAQEMKATGVQRGAFCREVYVAMDMTDPSKNIVEVYHEIA